MCQRYLQESGGRVGGFPRGLKDAFSLGKRSTLWLQLHLAVAAAHAGSGGAAHVRLSCPAGTAL